MSLPKRHIDVNGDMPVRDLLRLLNVPGDSVTMLAPRGAVEVTVHEKDTVSRSSMTFEERKELARSALGGWQDLIDLDELERRIYESRDQEPIRPPVVLD
jgi:hypothetical protein